MYRISGLAVVVGRGDDRRGAAFRPVVPDDDGVGRREVDRGVLVAVLAARLTVRLTVLLALFTVLFTVLLAVLLAPFAVPEARRFAVAARRVVDEARAAPRDDASRASR
jgi:hypothetical protein